MSGTVNLTDLSQESVLWTTGELLSPGDLNDAQYLMERRLVDQVFGPLLVGPGSTSTTGIMARPIGAGFSLTKDPSFNMSFWVRSGTLLWKQAADPGSPQPINLVHRMAADLNIAVDTADGTHDRIDIVSYKVEYDALNTGSADAATRVTKTVGGTYTSQTLDLKRRTKLTITYTPGSPAASPVAPATPAGQVLFGTILVGTGVTSILGANISDFRTPAGQTIVSIPMTAGSLMGGSGFAEGLNGWAASGSGQTLYFPVGVQSILSGIEDLSFSRWNSDVRHLRIKRIKMVVKIDTSPTGYAKLGRFPGSSGSTYSTGLLDMTAALTDGVGGTYVQNFDALDAPYWANVAPNPETTPEALPAFEINSGAAADYVRALVVEFWGI